MVGRYASEAAEPFPPRVKAAGVTLPPSVVRAATEALQAAWESTLPWAPKAELQRKAEKWLSKALKDAGFSDILVQVTVMDDLPYTVR